MSLFSKPGLQRTFSVCHNSKQRFDGNINMFCKNLYDFMIFKFDLDIKGLQYHFLYILIVLYFSIVK